MFVDLLLGATHAVRDNEFHDRDRRLGEAAVIHIDIAADLNMVDDDDRNLARLPAGSSRIIVGDVAAAGRPGFWSWVLVDEIVDGSVFFRQISSTQTASHGELAARSTD